MKLVFKMTGVEQEVNVTERDNGLAVCPVNTRGLYFYDSLERLAHFWETPKAFKEKTRGRKDDLTIAAEAIARGKYASGK